MKFVVDQVTGRNVIGGYRPGQVIVNGTIHTCNLIVTPERVVAPWTSAAFETLAHADLAQVLALDPDIVLIGTGKALRHLEPALRAPFLDRRIGIDCMDTGAACRCYAVLAAEGRNVAAALLVEPG